MNSDNEKRGKLFVIEGLDGCGKSTQLEMLKEKAADDIRFISFPNYDSASGEIIKDYLSGKFCEENGRTGAYTAGSFYAIDPISATRPTGKRITGRERLLSPHATPRQMRYIRWQSSKSHTGTNIFRGLKIMNMTSSRSRVPKR